jgi:hypothetical protein
VHLENLDEDENTNESDQNSENHRLVYDPNFTYDDDDESDQYVNVFGSISYDEDDDVDDDDDYDDDYDDDDDDDEAEDTFDISNEDSLPPPPLEQNSNLDDRSNSLIFEVSVPSRAIDVHDDSAPSHDHPDDSAPSQHHPE